MRKSRPDFLEQIDLFRDLSEEARSAVADDFQWLYRNRPEIADAVIRDLGRRLRELVGLVETIALRDVPERVATLIVSSARERGTFRVGGSVDMGRTQAAMADELGTTREGVARALGRLVKAGAIQRRGPHIQILDPESLQRAGGRT